MHTVNLCALPNLFVSYSDDEDLPTLLQSFLKQLNDDNKGIILALSFGSIISKQLEAFTEQSNIFIAYNHNGDEKSEVRNIDEFIQQLLAEMKNRTALLKTKRLILLPSMVVFMDDIFEVLRSHNRKTTNAFIQLLRKGSLVKIYFIMGSSGIYRSLLLQIINASLTKVTTAKAFHPAKNSPVPGAELVMSFDGLIFFKEKSMEIYTKYYPMEKNGL